MEQIQWKVAKVIDAHVHYRYRMPVEHYNKILELVNYTKANILTGREPEGLDRKREAPQKFYTFGMLPHDPAKLESGDGAYRVQLLEDLIARGYDGVKMMEGKPGWCVQWKTPPIDHDYFRPFWARAEEMDVPITLHMADPLDYWWADREGSYSQPAAAGGMFPPDRSGSRTASEFANRVRAFPVPLAGPGPTGPAVCAVPQDARRYGDCR